jgi:hypothetical protein
MSTRWQIIFHPDQSVEYKDLDHPDESLKVQFEGAHDVVEPQQNFADGGSRLVVYGTLKLKSKPSDNAGSWGIGN